MRIGIIGGGQLGLMMAEAAKKYGFQVVGLDPNPDCPLSRIANEIIVGDYSDEYFFRQLVNTVDFITYEFENVDLKLIHTHEKLIPQKADGLYYSRNRITEKKYVNSIGIPTAKFEEYSLDYIYKSPVIIKTTTGGYDGKGQYVIKSENDLDQFKCNIKNEYIVEELIDFDYEVSVIVSRDKNGSVVSYPIPVNSHMNGILFTSTINGKIPEIVENKAIQYTKQLIEELDYVGTLSVEYFVIKDKVIFNEFAPRPHNSGHYSIEGCSVSQFENHIRAIVGLDLLKPRLIHHSLMINVLGQDVKRLYKEYGSNVFIHDYHKKEAKENRKMGHITIVNSDDSEINIIKKMIVEDLV